MKKKVKLFARQIKAGGLERRYVLKDFSIMLDNQVDAERSYHRHVLSVLEELHAELILAMHAQESSQPATEQSIFVPTGDATQHVHNQNQDYDYFFRKVIHPFDTQADGI